MQIIVSRYNEDITWTKKYPNVLIYNKGLPLNLPNELNIANVGREGHTYYTYIYNNYDKLHTHTVFLQGNPFDHSPRILEKLNMYNNKPELLNQIDFVYLSEKILKTNINGCRYHRNLPIKAVFQRLFSLKTTYLDISFGAGAQFIVSRKNIHRRPRDFYRKIIDILKRNINPIEGYVIERLHGLILNSYIPIIDNETDTQDKPDDTFPINPFSRGYRHKFE